MVFDKAEFKVGVWKSQSNYAFGNSAELQFRIGFKPVSRHKRAHLNRWKQLPVILPHPILSCFSELLIILLLFPAVVLRSRCFVVLSVGNLRSK